MGQQEIWELMKDGKERTSKQISEILGYRNSTTSTYLRKIMVNGLLQRRYGGDNRKSFYYWRK